MCNKITVITLIYVAVFVTVVRSEEESKGIVDFLSKGTFNVYYAKDFYVFMLK